MTEIITPSNIVFAIGIISLMFSIWGKVKTPQDALDKQVAVEREEVEGKAKVLEQRVQWEKESSEKKFVELGKRLDDAFLLASNHTHTVDVKVDELKKIVGTMSNEITKLATIIEERIPRK